MKLDIAWTLVLLLTVSACSLQQQQEMRTARDNALGLFGFHRKPATIRAPDPKPAPAPAASPEKPKEEDEPVPVAAPRAPVETERVSPPPGGRTGRKS